MDLSLSFYKVTKDTDDKSFIGEESGKMLTDITKALKALNEEATIVEIGLPEHISEDTRERLEQVVTHFKAVSMKDTGNYVLCSCFDNNNSLNDLALMTKNDFFVFKYETNYEGDFITSNIAVLTTDTGKDVISYLADKE